MGTNSPEKGEKMEDATHPEAMEFGSYSNSRMVSQTWIIFVKGTKISPCCPYENRWPRRVGEDEVRWRGREGIGSLSGPIYE